MNFVSSGAVVLLHIIFPRYTFGNFEFVLYILISCCLIDSVTIIAHLF